MCHLAREYYDKLFGFHVNLFDIWYHDMKINFLEIQVAVWE